MDNTHNVAQATVRDKKLRQLRQQLDTMRFYKSLFKTPEGERVLKDLYTRFGLYDPCYNPQSPDKDDYFKLGQRNVMLFLKIVLSDDEGRIKEAINEL